MDPNVLQTLTDADLIQAREHHFARLRSLYDGTLTDLPFVLQGRSGWTATSQYTQPGQWVEDSLADLAAHADAIKDTRIFRPLVIEAWQYGVHFVDRILGAEVYDLDGTGNWQAHYLTTPVGELRTVDLDSNETWNLAARTAQAFVRTGVTVPVFGLPVIASVWNIAINLYGQEIILAMYTNPEAARRDLATINSLLCEMHRRFMSILPEGQLQPVCACGRCQPPGYGQLCGCSTQLLSPELYRDFIAPLDDQLLSVYPNGGMIHLCGTHTQHIPVWREMRSLRAAQLNDRAAEDLAIYFNELRDDQILYVNPCDGMPIERILEITGGRRAVMVAEWTPG